MASIDFEWPVAEPSESLVILFGAGASISDTANPESRMPLGADLRDLLIKQSSKRRGNDARDDLRKAKMDPARATFDEVWQTVVNQNAALPQYHKILLDAFVDKPIPCTYSLLAHLFFMCPCLGAFATINFDPIIDQAIEEVGRLYGKRHLKDYSIIATREQFRYFTRQARKLPLKPFLKLHGTLEHPQSILAGLPKSKSSLFKRSAPVIYEDFLGA